MGPVFGEKKIYQGRNKVPRTGGARYFLVPHQQGVPGICLTPYPAQPPKKVLYFSRKKDSLKCNKFMIPTFVF